MGKILKIGVPIDFVRTASSRSRSSSSPSSPTSAGLTDAAAVGIVEKVISFLFLVPSSMLSTVSALGAQNIGAGKPERARQTLWYAVALAGRLRRPDRRGDGPVYRRVRSSPSSRTSASDGAAHGPLRRAVSARLYL